MLPRERLAHRHVAFVLTAARVQALVFDQPIVKIELNGGGERHAQLRVDEGLLKFEDIAQLLGGRLGCANDRAALGARPHRVHRREFMQASEEMTTGFVPTIHRLDAGKRRADRPRRPERHRLLFGKVATHDEMAKVPDERPQLEATIIGVVRLAARPPDQAVGDAQNLVVLVRQRFEGIGR